MAGWLYRITVKIKEFGEQIRSAVISKIGFKLRDLVMRLKISFRKRNVTA